MAFSIESVHSMAAEISRQLMASLAVSADRQRFFQQLSMLFREHVQFDRLCINLYDSDGDMLMYFTAAEGALASTLSPVRPAEVGSTVAGQVIATRQPVIITDLAQYFPESSMHPIAEAGLTATMAFPLIINNEIIATLHCSFARVPEQLYEITALFMECSPVVALCVGTILSQEHRQEGAGVPHGTTLPVTDEYFVCHSKRMRAFMRTLSTVAKMDIPVLLLGETGTGKTLAARMIHQSSARQHAPFVKVNCPSLSPTLFESELFGHARGSFTGATSKRTGRFEHAHGGTLFLDELSELSAEMQSKLLQVLEDSRFERVGESASISVDVRVLAATNVRINEALRRGTLREDLFHRLSSFILELPPLRERLEDLPPLVTMLAARLVAERKLTPIKLSQVLLMPLNEYSWPGNVRELRNVIMKMLIHQSIHKSIDTATVRAIIEENRSFMPHSAPSPVLDVDAGPVFSARLEDVERQHIERVLRQTRGVLSGADGAAALLGIPRSTLQHRLQKLGIVVENQKAKPHRRGA